MLSAGFWKLDEGKRIVSNHQTKGPSADGDRTHSRRDFLTDAATVAGSLVVGGLMSSVNGQASAKSKSVTGASAEAEKGRDLYVFFTMDCERVVDRDMSRHGIWGPPDWKFSERSIRRFHAILADEGLIATDFIVPDVAKAHAKLWSELAAGGNELGMHLHPQGFGDFRWDRFMPEYGEPDQLKLLDEATTAWKDAIGHRPRVFRPGNFSGSPTIFPTLAKAGLVAGSVSLPGRVRRGYFADWAGFPSEAQFLPKEVDRADAFLELPVTTSRKHIRNTGDRQEPLHLRVEARSIDPDMFREIIREQLEAPLIDPSLPRILVVMTHNTPNYAEAKMEKRLRDLIQAIRDSAKRLNLRVVNTGMLELRKTLLKKQRA